MTLNNLNTPCLKYFSNG
uniref:Uncharacterized protein n=1 Tax=Lepeophtheirus salmonis TaxID=72036 RepID=A0A0K2UMF8_LEPSM